MQFIHGIKNKIMVLAFILAIFIAVNVNVIACHTNHDTPVSISLQIECDDFDELRIDDIAISAGISQSYPVTFLYNKIIPLQLTDYIFQPPKIA